MPNPFENHPLHPENAAEAATPPVRTPDDVLDEFGKAPLPDAIDGLLFRLSMADPDDPAVTGFERYAARILSEAHAVLLRCMALGAALARGLLHGVLLLSVKINLGMFFIIPYSRRLSTRAYAENCKIHA